MNMRMTIATSALALAFATTGAAPAFPQETIRLTVATGHAPIVNWVKLLDEFYLPEIDRRLAETGRYKIEWTKGYSSTIAKIGGEIDAVEQGVVDMAIVGASFNPDKLPLQIVSYYTPFATEDLGTIVNTVDELNRTNKAMQKLWDDNGLKYLAAIGVDNFELFSTKEVKSYKEIVGLKVGGIGPNLNWLLDGTSGVMLQPNSAYTDLQTGVYQAALAPTSLGLTLRIADAAPYLLKVDFGAMCFGAVAMNAEVFNGLPEDVQAIIEGVGREYQQKLIAFTDETVARNVADMQAKGLRIIEVPDEDKRAWAAALPNIAAKWAATMEEKGLPARDLVRDYLSKVRARGGAVVRDWTDGL
jgi:TRAP-type C4-dicarboxylate transport system substrate-binding protein